MRASVAIVLAAVALGLSAPVASATYTGTVDSGSNTATLTGSGAALITAAGGVLHHGDAGPGFASDADFDSAAAGDQTVPDTGGWTLNVSGGGKDKLTVQEGEPAGPLSYAFGHTFFPGGVPCAVRDPNERGGSISFSRHPAQETRICFPSGFDEVAVKAAQGDTDFTVLDTEPGVTLRITGGPGSDELSEAANVPSSVTEVHNPESPVHFSGGNGADYLTLNDGPAKSPATYTIGNGAMRKTGLPPLFFDSTVESLSLYPQDGPSTIIVKRTGGALLQVFGGFFGQAGPDKVDATGADAPLFMTGSSGDDAIKGSAFQDYIDGGGGKDTIDSRDSALDQVLCRGASGTVKVDTLDLVTDCPSGKASPPQTALWRAAFTPKKVKRGKRLTLDAVSTLPGKVALTFKRSHARAVTKTVSVKRGPDTVSFKPPRRLVKGKYAVSAVLRAAGGKKSRPVKLTLTVR
jgi:hypothetical protein